MSIHYTNAWHAIARPDPTDEDFNIQLGCHLEEVVEMLDEASFAFLSDDEVDYAAMVAGLEALATGLKKGTIEARIDNRKAFLDALGDQVVTVVGVGYCAHMAMPPAVDEINRSNFSKFVNGVPLRDANGKIAKGPNYTPPNLEGMY